MNASQIGKLERVSLREVWKHEAKDFTQWLQENIDVLNSALDLNLVNVDRERDTGDFSVDLVAEDDGGGTIIIEDQLEKSNHDHLGKLITYLTGMGARAAIWIVSDPRPEHVAAIAWLNESSKAQPKGKLIELRLQNKKTGKCAATCIRPRRPGKRHLVVRWVGSAWKARRPAAYVFPNRAAASGRRRNGRLTPRSA